MQLVVKIHLESPLRLPLHYRYVLQSAIYRLLRETKEFASLHETGHRLGGKNFKLFVFSDLSGNYQREGASLFFQGEMTFEIRSYKDSLIMALAQQISTSGIRFGSLDCFDIEMELKNLKFSQKSLQIRQLSPITVYQTDEARHSIYYNPLDAEFEALINENLKSKSLAAGRELDLVKPIQISFKRLSYRDQLYTEFKTTKIVAWYGEYFLKGEPEDLTFLYNTGLGTKNSQGFGMFEILK